jgi:hypothetical protein
MSRQHDRGVEQRWARTCPTNLRNLQSAGHRTTTRYLNLDMRDITGFDEARVAGKVRRAYEQFKTAPSDGALHFLVLETDHTVHFGTVADALFGREYVDFMVGGGMRRGRHNDGVFCRGQHSRLTGVLIARRAARHRLFTPYKLTFFPNPGGAMPVDEMMSALDVEEILGPDDYP